MSSMLSPWQAGLALAAAMLALTACDPRAPSVPTPKADPAATQQGAAPVPGTVQAATVAPAATAPIAQTRLPSTARPGEAGLDSLAEYVGKYPYDGTNYLEQSVLADRLKALLGSRYPTLLSNMRTVGPLTREGDVWSIVGLRPHQGGEEMGAIVIDPARNALRVWLLSDGQQADFTDVSGPDIAWPEQVSKTLANIEARPAS